MSRLTIVEGNSNDKDNVRVIMVKGQKGDMGDLNHNDIIDNLTSTATDKVLSANQGKRLKDLVDGNTTDLNKKIYYFNSIETMKNNDLKEGDIIITTGYYESNDGGASKYEIVDNDALIDDGGSIINLENGLKAQLIPNSKLNVMQFGIKEETNITSQIKKLLTYVETQPFITEVEFNSKTYEMNDATATHLENREYFKINFNGCHINYTGTTKNEGALFRLFFKDTDNAICELENGSFDGSSIQPDFSSTNTNPISLRSVLHVVYAKTLNVKNCTFSNWFFSRCVNSNGVELATIENCTGINCGGRSAGANDSHGDALYFQRIGVKLIYDENGYTKYIDGNNTVYWYDTTNDIVYDSSYNPSNVSISDLSQDLSDSKSAYIYVNNCDFSSYEAVEDMYPDTNALNGCKSGRCGIVFGEYSLTDTDKFLYVTNSSFYNYQRTIHIENVKNVNVSIDNSRFLEYGTCILGSGQIAGINNFNITNCIFNKTIEIRAMYNNYDYIFTGGNDNKIKNFTFDNCEFKNLAGKILIYGKNIPLIIKNSNIEVENLYFFTNVYVKFENCNIKSNTQGGYRTIYNFENCNIEPGYKYDSNSSHNYVPGTPSDLYFDTTQYGYIKNCYLKNFGYQFRNNVIFKNNHFVYDENFPGNGSDASKKYCILINNINNIYIESNIVENSNTALYYFTNESSISDHIVQIINNTIYNLRFSLWNSSKFRCQVMNNRLINTNENIVNAFSFYGSKLIACNNYMYGYTTPFASYTNVLQYNNYKIEDTQTTLIS